MVGRSPPVTPSPLQRAIAAEAERQGLTAYRLQIMTGLPLNTVQRFLALQGSPTLATVEVVAKALGMVLRADPETRPARRN